MNIVESMKQKLEKKQIDYQLITLPEDLPLDVASHIAFHGISIQQAIPTLLYSTEKGLIAVQKRADTKINLEKLRKLTGLEKLHFASEEQLEELGMKPGIVALVGLSIPHFMDKKVLDSKEIYGGTGIKTYALKMQSKDLQKINNAIIGDFTESEEKKRVYSGIRATGRLHLGNYLGAIKGMFALQEKYECIFSVVDIHSLTTPYDRTTLKQSVKDIILDYLAAGLDPEKCKLEIQSQIPQHTELSFLLATIYPLAPLEDLPTFKEKKAQYPKNVNVGLLYYPILMAADILLYKGELVPVGIDQEPHLEVAREIARKFNSTFGQTFPEPRRFKTMGEYVPSLFGKGKMSKTIEGSFINLADSLETIKKKLAKVPTDSGTSGGDVPKEGGVASLFALLALFNQDDMHKKFKQDYIAGNIRYGEMKTYIAEAIYKELQPIQEKRKYFEDHPEVVDKIVEKSREGCLIIAQETMREVKEKMGLI